LGFGVDILLHFIGQTSFKSHILGSNRFQFRQLFDLAVAAVPQCESLTFDFISGRAQQALAIALQNPPYGQDPSYAVRIEFMSYHHC
jgi:hypothetical protein